MRCTACGAELLPEDRFCRACGAPCAQLPPQFAEAQARFADLQAQYRAGQLTDEAYEQALRAILVQDASGYWMLGPDSGAWYWYDGQRWVLRDPPAAGAGSADGAPDATGTVSAPRAPRGRDRRERPARRRLLPWLSIGIPLLIAALGVVLLFATHRGAVVRHSLAILFDPGDVSHYLARGAAYGDLEAHERAAADYGRAIELAPGAAYAYLQRALHYRALGRAQEAIADLGVVVLLDPERCLAYLWRGDLWREAGDARRAQADYERVVALGDACHVYQDAVQALAEMGVQPGAQAMPTPPVAPWAQPVSGDTATPTAASQPTPTAEE
ncbi:MAG: zinc-ribbon domain-containing protein [Anaerolineae bacterium]|nr:zinc-ribbon domain-containing protein [Anaerolineae bacterium]